MFGPGTGGWPPNAGAACIGGQQAIDLSIRTFVNPGDVVLVPEPGYQAYIGGALTTMLHLGHIDERQHSEWHGRLIKALGEPPGGWKFVGW